MSKVKIIQPGRIGDIVICLPIAKYYSDNGYDVYWPVCSKYFDLFSYVDYVKPIMLCDDLDKSTFEAKTVSIDIPQIDLMINFGSATGPNQKDWEASSYSFDEWKYYKSDVPFSEKTKLQINRNSQKENELFKHLNLNMTDNYVVRHKQGTWCSYEFKKQLENCQDRIIDIEPIVGYTIFDWIGVIESSNHSYAVDSSIANMINGLNLCIGKRTFQAWWSVYDTRLGAEKLVPKLEPDWIILK